jgi:biotin carboxyl carrier protein
MGFTKKERAHMKKSYTAYIGSSTFIVEREDAACTINGKKTECSISPFRDRTYLLSFDNSIFEISVPDASEQSGPRTVMVNGRAFSVLVEDEKDALLKKYDMDKATKVHAAIIKAPMPGKITKILISQGEFVEAGQGVLILEAMKMENEIKSTAAGIVKSVHVKEASAVEKGAVLIEIH